MVRESLEQQTMDMAKAAAALFAENLTYLKWRTGKGCNCRYNNRSGWRKCSLCREIQKEGVDITLTVTPCWC